MNHKKGQKTWCIADLQDQGSSLELLGPVIVELFNLRATLCTCSSFPDSQLWVPYYILQTEHQVHRALAQGTLLNSIHSTRSSYSFNSRYLTELYTVHGCHRALAQGTLLNYTQYTDFTEPQLKVPTIQYTQYTDFRALTLYTYFNINSTLSPQRFNAVYLL